MHGASPHRAGHQSPSASKAKKGGEAEQAGPSGEKRRRTMKAVPMGRQGPSPPHGRAPPMEMTDDTTPFERIVPRDELPAVAQHQPHQTICECCKAPIHSLKYSCLECGNFDICSTCHLENTPFTHPTHLRSHSRNPTHTGFDQASSFI